MSFVAVDLFAGAGGSSTGLRAAGATIAACVNHWPVAVASHAAAHPEAEHHCEDAAVLDPTTLPRHDLLWASPSCTGHTRARGVDRPHHDAARATAWCVVRVAEAHRPPALVVENVPDFARWPLYPAWCHALALLGYALTETVIDAADCGVPQERRRLFIVGVRGRVGFDLPRPREAHRAAAEVIDLDSGVWRPWSTYAPASVARITAARRARGPVCLVPYYGSRSSHAGRDLGRPIGTLTTRDRYVVVKGDVARVLTVEEQLALAGFDRAYPLTGTRRERVAQVGNAVCPPVAEYIGRALAGAA